MKSYKFGMIRTAILRLHPQRPEWLEKIRPQGIVRSINRSKSYGL